MALKLMKKRKTASVQKGTGSDHAMYHKKKKELYTCMEIQPNGGTFGQMKVGVEHLHCVWLLLEVFH